MAIKPPSKIEQHGKTWRLAGDVLMDNANFILQESKALSMGDEFLVDFSAVGKVDTAALSLMMEWQRRALASSARVSFANLPLNLSRLVAVYGLTDFMPVSSA
ncbi:MAG: STAS domain-containing protein [Methylotenera sp.]|nr:STAS domain-containing protein [Methylotenera sp.]